MACSGPAEIITDFGEYKFGASMIPDEDDLKQFPVQYGCLCDPNGYNLQIIERSTKFLERIILNVLDLNDSIEFYMQAFGMTLLRKRSNVNNIPKSASMCAYMVRINIGDFYGERVALHYKHSGSTSIHIIESLHSLHYQHLTQSNTTPTPLM